MGERSGFVEIDGPPGQGAGSENLTRWDIGESLTIGGTQVGSSTGLLSISDAVVHVGTSPAHGMVTINAGGRVTGFGQLNFLLTNGGTIHNDGIVSGPMVLGGSYDAGSHGSFAPAFGSLPIVIPRQPPAHARRTAPVSHRRPAMPQARAAPPRRHRRRDRSSSPATPISATRRSSSSS
ncbi:MAG: hypothetical protein HY271_15135 [Deltaproteobacteria bacterium]|nr:hypothetical protein [Deltaproteobacteria bacterium]